MSALKNDLQLLAIGKQCSHPSCLLVDFLPFKCNHCEDYFCQEHFKVDAHNCLKYDESKHNRVAPNCPFCNIPVAVRPGQDPNVRMEEHFSKECTVMTGKSGKARTMPICARGNCKKVLFSPIRCDKCKNQFCPAHRFPSDHDCLPQQPPPSSTKPTPSSTKPSVTHLFTHMSIKSTNTTASAASKTRLGALRKAVGSPTTPAAAHKSKPPSISKPPSSKSVPSSSQIKPFSKVDRRAKAERESRRKAMQARAQKGLLSEEEKAILAADAEEDGKEKACIIM